ncbi:hypothetical protein AMATHDRAFT_120794, partial [Amanita thiersii Skay4041]
MFRRIFIAFACCFYLAQAAPTAVDKPTVLSNARQAQKLNLQFKSLKATDPCSAEAERACISRSIAVCKGGAWETARGRCSRSQGCFALPSITSVGTAVTCTTEENALALFSNTGAIGGIDG